MTQIQLQRLRNERELDIKQQEADATTYKAKLEGDKLAETKRHNLRTEQQEDANIIRQTVFGRSGALGTVAQFI